MECHVFHHRHGGFFPAEGTFHSFEDATLTYSEGISSSQTSILINYVRTFIV